MDAALLVTTVATRLGDRCGLLAFDRDGPGRGRARRTAGASSGRVTDALYDLEPALVDSDYASAFHQTLARFRRRSLIVLLTDLVEQAVGESLLPALPGDHPLAPAAGRRHPGPAGPSVGRRGGRPTTSRPTGRPRRPARCGPGPGRLPVCGRLGATVVDAPPAAPRGRTGRRVSRHEGVGSVVVVVRLVVSMGLGILAAWVVLVLVLLILRPRAVDLAEAKRFVPDLARLVAGLARDPSLGRAVRARGLLLVAYLASPIDLVPDFVPVLGYADDVAVVAIVLRSVVRRAGPGALDRQLRAGERPMGSPLVPLASSGIRRRSG